MNTNDKTDLHIDLQFYGLCEEAAGFCRFDLTVYRGEEACSVMPLYIKERYLISLGDRVERYLHDRHRKILEGQIDWYDHPDGDSQPAGYILKKEPDGFVLKVTSPRFARPFCMRLDDSDLESLAMYLRDPY